MICSDGEEIDLGGVTLRFLAVGGHAPGNLAVFIPEERTLLASDSLGFHYPGGGFFPVFFTGYGEYMATLDRLESLHPERLGLGHYGWMRGSGGGRGLCPGAAVRVRPPGAAERTIRRDEETAVCG